MTGTIGRWNSRGLNQKLGSKRTNFEKMFFWTRIVIFFNCWVQKCKNLWRDLFSKDFVAFVCFRVLLLKFRDYVWDKGKQWILVKCGQHGCLLLVNLFWTKNVINFSFRVQICNLLRWDFSCKDNSGFEHYWVMSFVTRTLDMLLFIVWGWTVLDIFFSKAGKIWSHLVFWCSAVYHLLGPAVQRTPLDSC